MSKTWQTLKTEIVECVKSKTYGCFVALAALVLTIIQIFAYPFVQPATLYNPGVIVSAVFGIVLFVGLSLFRKTSDLAPIALMVCNLLALISFASAEGIVDEFSTLFFSGFSIGKIFSLPTAVWLSMICFIFALIISSVAVFLPQNKKAVSVKEEE